MTPVHDPDLLDGLEELVEPWSGHAWRRLAAEEHLARWRGRNEEHRGVLGERFDQAGVLHDWEASVQVARWAYGQVERAGGQVWVEGEVLRGLSGEWERVLA